jgi:hypothetical protein
MRTSFALAGVMTVTMACTSVPPDGQESVPTHANPAFTCDAAPAQSLVGRPATTELAAEAQRLSGAGIVRWLQPGQIVTMEFREDRLNIELDAQNKVVAIRCG